MNRRRFLQSLVAALSIPGNTTMSLRSVAAAVPSAAAVPTNARFWAVYMSALHGECTPKTLQNLLHIPENEAKNYVGQLIADGVIKPNPLLHNSVSKILKRKEDGLLDRAKKRLEMKMQANSHELETNTDTSGPTGSEESSNLPETEHSLEDQSDCERTVRRVAEENVADQHSECSDQQFPE